MSHTKQFEKKVFLLFFLFVFLIFFLMSLISWQILVYFLRRSEDAEILEIKSEIADFYQQTKSENHKIFSGIEELISALGPNLYENYSEISQIFTEYENRIPNTILYLIGHDETVIYGTDWDLTQAYISEISQELAFRESNYFLTSKGSDVYFFHYQKAFDDFLSESFFFLSVSLIPNRSWSTSENLNIFLTTFPSETSDSVFRELTPKHEKRINKRLAALTQHSQNSLIYRINYHTAISCVIYYDIKNNPSVLVYFFYPRDFNKIAHQSLLLYFLLVLAFSLVIISIAGAWFSKAILQPIHQLNHTMKEISDNPENPTILSSKYSGILGEMVITFNNMNRALKNYASSLIIYKVILNNLDSGILWTDKNLNIVLANPAFFKIFQVKTDKNVINTNLFDYIQTTENLNLPGTRYETPLIRNTANIELTINGIRKFIRYSILNVESLTTEKDLNYIISLTDISTEIRETRARENLELELIKSNRLADLGSKIEGIVHNLNSPLNSIMGYAQLFIAEHPGDKDVSRIMDGCKVISHYVKGLLSKLKETNISMKRPVNINDIVDQELEMCDYNFFFKNNVQVFKDITEDLPSVYVTFADISLVVANILSNSIKALENRDIKHIYVKTSLDDNFVIVEIRDTGSGIKDEHMKILFEPVFSTKYKNENSGFGLGLAISKNIITKYSGKILIDSVYGEGTCVTIKIPVIEN